MSEEKKLKVTAEPHQLSISLERTFDYPKDLVFKAFEDSELIKQWWGVSENITIDAHEPKAGGSWRYVEKSTDEKGNDVEYAFHGVHHTFSKEEGVIVRTFEFEGMPGHVLLETLNFVEEDGKTTINGISVFQSHKDREGMMSQGMEWGANKSYNQLEELLHKIQ